MGILGVAGVIGLVGLAIRLFTWWYKPEHVRGWFKRKTTRESPPPEHDHEVTPSIDPYRSSSPSGRVDDDVVTARLTADLGGMSGPSAPRMIIRYDVPQYVAKGYEIVHLDDGREIVWTGQVSNRSIQECVLMARMPISRKSPPPPGYVRCTNCGTDHHRGNFGPGEQICSACGQAFRVWA